MAETAETDSKEKLRIRGGLVENQRRPTQAAFCISGCLTTIYICNINVLSNKPCLHAQLQKFNRSY